MNNTHDFEEELRLWLSNPTEELVETLAEMGITGPAAAKVKKTMEELSDAMADASEEDWYDDPIIQSLLAELNELMREQFPTWNDIAV